MTRRSSAAPAPAHTAAVWWPGPLPCTPGRPSCSASPTWRAATQKKERRNCPGGVGLPHICEQPQYRHPASMRSRPETHRRHPAALQAPQVLPQPPRTPETVGHHDKLPSEQQQRESCRLQGSAAQSAGRTQRESPVGASPQHPGPVEQHCPPQSACDRGCALPHICPPCPACRHRTAKGGSRRRRWHRTHPSPRTPGRTRARTACAPHRSTVPGTACS
mmetsp:Transcript_8383/g.25181  ORF Transcript_8383/g.25181 Transcript_8383/m.25181 type:complete len:219 (+) Transcript_8383:2755-3411(+)